MTYLLLAAAYVVLACVVGRGLAANNALPPPPSYRRSWPGNDGAVSVPGRKHVETPEGVEAN